MFLRDLSEIKRQARRYYCLDLLCLLTCSAVRRMRRLMAACSFRASLSVSATTFSVAPMRRAASASSSQRARSSSLGWLRLPRSQAGMVECCVCGSGAGFMKNITAQLRCHTKGLRLIPHTYFQSTCCQRGSVVGSGGSLYFLLSDFPFHPSCTLCSCDSLSSSSRHLAPWPSAARTAQTTENGDCVIKRVQLRLKPATLSLQITHRFG
jgi:hypothetical protein